jgi:hypothetical protein
MAVGDLSLPPNNALLTLTVSEPTVPHQMKITFGARLASGTMSPANMSALWTVLTNALKPIWPTSVHMSALHALIGNDGPPMAGDYSSDATGSRVGVSLAPPAVSMILTRKTAFAGRQYRGRIFLPFANETNINSAGTLDPSDVTILTNIGIALDAIPAGSPSANINSWVILHREPKTGSVPSPTPVTVHLASNRVATQRRRMER